MKDFKDLWSPKQEKPSICATTDENVDPITAEELTEIMKFKKNKKTLSL
jgi:hypothetical protein